MGLPTSAQKWGALARRLIRANERFSVRQATIATAVAATQARSLSERYRRSVEHIPNGVDANELSSSAGALELLQSATLSELGGYVLFAAARVDPTKGCHTLLEALHLMQEPPGVLVVGRPLSRGRVRRPDFAIWPMACRSRFCLDSTRSPY